jgi:DNA-binding LytR/AlgR family response regulator
LNEVICRFKGKQRRQVTPMDLCYGKLQFNTLHGFFLIELSDIVYVKADGNYSIVHLKDGSNKVITMNLGQIEERLTGFRFFRMDRSLVINLQSLIFVNRKDRYCTVDYNGSTVDFSIKRSRIKQLVEMF